jgi:hypothetical protein
MTADHHIRTEDVLRPAHRYLADMPSLRFIAMNQTYSNLVEKSNHLHFPLEDMLKTIYFEERGKERPRRYGVVLSAEDMVDKNFLHSLTETTDMRLAKTLPYAMAPGSCAPFVSHDDVQHGIVHRIYVANNLFAPSRYNRIVELAPPGRPEISMRVRFSHLADQLWHHFPSLYHQAPIYQEVRALEKGA